MQTPGSSGAVVSRRIGLVIAGVVVAVLLWVGWNRRSDSARTTAPRAAGSPAAPAVAGGSPPVPGLPSSLPPVPPTVPVAPVRARARLSGRILLSEGTPASAYRLFVFDAGGEVEANEAFTDVDRFDVGPLEAGRKVVIAVFPSGEAPAAAAAVDVPEEGTATVALRPPPQRMLEGEVVLPSGLGAAGLLVTFTEPLPAEAGLKGALRDGAGRIIHVGGGSGQATTRYFDLDVAGGTVTRSATTDAKGRFRVMLASQGAPVEFEVLKALGQPLKTEAVLPDAGTVRIVVPGS